MGEAVDRLLALSGVSHVEGYTRKTKTGKTVHVDAYTRTLKPGMKVENPSWGKGTVVQAGATGVHVKLDSGEEVFANKQSMGNWKPVSGNSESKKSGGSFNPDAQAEEFAKKNSGKTVGKTPTAKAHAMSDVEIADMADLLLKDWGTPMNEDEKAMMEEARRRAGHTNFKQHPTFDGKLQAWIEKIMGPEWDKAEAAEIKAPGEGAVVREQFTSPNGSKVARYNDGAATINGKPVSRLQYDEALRLHTAAGGKKPENTDWMEEAAKAPVAPKNNKLQALKFAQAYSKFSKAANTKSGQKVKDQLRADIKALAVEKGWVLDMLDQTVQDPDGNIWSLTSGQQKK